MHIQQIFLYFSLFENVFSDDSGMLSNKCSSLQIYQQENTVGFMTDQSEILFFELYIPHKYVSKTIIKTYQLS